MAFFYPYYEILTIIGMILLLMAAPFHLRMKGTSTWPFILWSFIWCLLRTVNGMVWHDRMDNIAPIWCDISGRLEMGAMFGVTASTITINRRVYRITSDRSQIVERRKRRDLAIDLLLGFGVPALMMAFQSVVQDHRGTIIEGLGCVPVINQFTLTYPLVLVWPSILSFVAAIYACLSFRIFLSLRRRNTIDELFSSGYSISKDHYLRLMGFSLIPILLTFPFTLTSLIINIKFGPVPWVSWEDAHSNFNHFYSVPAAVVEADPYVYATWMINLCACLVCCYLFFLFLGLNPEQRRQYRRWFFIILRPFGIKPALSSTDSPTVWQRLFGRTTTATTLTPTPFTFSGATASISKVPLAHCSRDLLNPTDVKVIGREIFEHGDYQRAERGESGNPREERLKAKAILGLPSNAPDRSKEDKKSKGYIA